MMPALGDVVRHVARVARPSALRYPVAEVDDAPAALRAHVRRGRVRAEKRGAQVDVDAASQSAAVEIGERLLHVDRRHVDQDVEAAEGIERRSAPARRRPPVATDPRRTWRRGVPRRGRCPPPGRPRPSTGRSSSATSTPRAASSRATTSPMRLPPVIRATLLVSSTRTDRYRRTTQAESTKKK